MTEREPPAPSDMLDWHEPPRRDRCECGDDMPGRCPGPANCPMCQADDEEDGE
jgi:hypothetical protein